MHTRASSLRTQISVDRREIRPTADRGPILLCVDTSGSMRGPREVRACVCEGKGRDGWRRRMGQRCSADGPPSATGPSLTSAAALRPALPARLQTVAKALALECMRAAKAQERGCYVFAFAGPQEVRCGP